MKFSIIETGGKQYKVSPGSKLKIEKVVGEPEGSFIFDKVLLTADGDKIELGRPYLDGKTAEGKILKQGRAKKVIVFKFKSKTRQRRKKGHRQDFTEVEITKI